MSFFGRKISLVEIEEFFRKFTKPIIIIMGR